MKRKPDIAKIIVCALVITAAVAAVSAATVFGARGYMMYRDAVGERSLEQRIEDVRSKENFTSYDELPQFYIDAVICTEDKRFETHNGIDPIAIARAAAIDLLTRSFVEGGSTITQQVAKNLLFDGEKRLERKAAEVFAAFALERCCTKDEIFELYVNIICFGSGYYCVYDAAEGYFGCAPAELNRYESAMLAGLPQAPSVYSPDSNLELAQRRTAAVLQRMVACDKITEQQALQIIDEGSDALAQAA